jgi:glutathionyl-hydroquinone reductase
MAWQLSALDRLEIQELYSRYAWGIDLADADMAMSTFAQDCWFDHLWQGKVQGHEAILKNLQSLWNDRQHWWYGRQHLMNHFIMEPREEEGEADVRCFFQIVQFNVDYHTNFVFGIGTRIDHVTRKEGVWRFQSLQVNAWTEADQVPWKGEMLLRRKPRHQAEPVAGKQ